MRPIWNGSISFGLVNIPVRMFSAANTHQGINFDMLHKSDHGQIHYSRVCSKDGKEIAWEDIVKGYEYREGEYIVMTPEELDSLDVKRTQTIDIQQFVAEGEIDIRYFEKPYYLEVVKGGEKAYALLRAALQKSDKLALAKFVLHGREHIAAIKPVGRALVLNQMRFPSDLREPGELNLPTDHEVTAKETEMAMKLIKQETKPFIAEDLHDTYTDDLEEMIKAKTKSKNKQAPAPKHQPEKADAKDLMSALKASLKS